jgi:hypothetical protein
MPVAVSPEQDNKLKLSLLVSAAGLEMTSWVFSTVGLATNTDNFLGAVVLIGIFEAAKLAGIAYTVRASFNVLKIPILAFIAIIAVLNTLGIYSFLSKQKISNLTLGSVTHQTLVAAAEAKLSNQQKLVDDLDKQIASIFTRIEKATASGRVNTAGQIAEDERKNLTRLQTDRLAQARQLADLKTDRAKLDGQKLVLNDDWGPSIQMIATTFHTDSETALKLLLLLIACLIEPGAVVFMAAATRR